MKARGAGAARVKSLLTAEIAGSERRGRSGSLHRWQIGHVLREQPAQEKHNGDVDYQLQYPVTHNVSGLQAQHAQQGQHPEGIDQVGQGLCGVVDLHHPAQVDVLDVCGFENIRRFDHPLASPRRNEDPQHC
jgi:hypothetical protein